MNLSREIIKKGSNKFLVCFKDPYLVSEFVEKVCSLFPEYQYQKCMNIDSFLELYHRGDIFSRSPQVLYLWDLTADTIKELAPLVAQPTEDILIFAERKVLPKNKLYSNFKAECCPINLESLNEKECLKWASARMASKSLVYDREMPKILIEKKSNNLYAIDSEIRKLKVIYGDREVGVTAIKYIAESSEARVFEFIEHLFHKRKEKALSEFYKFSEDYYVRLISTLIGYLEKIYKIAIYRAQKKTPEEIAEISGINKFIIKTKYFTILSVYNKVKLLKLIDLFNDLDYNLRISPLPNKLLFEAYIIKAFNI